MRDIVDVTVDDTVYCGLAGNDTITVDAANVVVLGGPGVDRITGGSFGTATIDGGTGADKLTAGPDGDTTNGDSGNDLITGGAGPDQLNGDSGNDNLNGGNGDDILQGGEGDDVDDGGPGNDIVSAGSGNDIVEGGDGDDSVDCGTGAVQLVADGSGSQDDNAADCSDDMSNSSAEGFHGTIAGYTPGASILVDTTSGPVTIQIDANTRIEVDGGGDPQIGDRVEVEADTDSNPPLALSIHAESSSGH